MQELTYFSNKELVKVTHAEPGVEVTPENVQSFYSPKLLLLLDALRRRCNIPIILTSGYRCSSYNKAIGGKSNSSHLSGLAMDFRCSDSAHRFYYIRAAISVGFSRIGIGKDYIHVDVDGSKSAGVIWLY